ncbi:AAA ATPase [Ascosphaera acerosa]|nr:AAA ATPase [Ascosphaera acerosa]
MALAGLRPTYTVYTSAKRLFARNASPGQLVGRETERDELQSVIASAVKSCKGSCVYISGPPGTGKSAVVGGLLGEFDIADYLKAQQGVKELRQIRTASVNCASMNNARDIFGRLLEELAPGTAQQQLFKKSASDALQDMFLAPIDQKAPTPFYIVTLDEVEHLLSTPITAHGMHSDDSSVLSTLFEWSLSARSRLLLIGVANALDLTDQFLPRLKSKNLKPILLPFMPYTPSQISKIITSKLQSLMSPEANGASSDSPPTEQPPPGFVPFMHPAAIQLCARKVASTTGDLRKAFELVRRAIDLVEKETMQARKAAADAAGLHTSDHREFPNLDPQSPTRPAQRAAVKQPLQENANLATRVTPPDTPGKPQRNSTPGTMPTLPTLTPANAPRATVAHVARVTSTVSGNGISDRLALLTLQQKAALCALIASNHSSASSSSQSSEDPGAASRVSTPRKSRSSQPASGSTDQTTVKRVFSTYVTMCRKEKLLVPLSSSEFSDILSSLESSGLIELANARSGPSTPSRTPRRRGLGDAGETIVQCFVSEQEVLSSLQGAGEGVLKTLIAN